MTKTAIETILETIEQARQAGEINGDAARAASVALQLEGNDAMLANRIIAQGADPASLEYLVTGSVSPDVARAHRQGPGFLEGGAREHWLGLAALSTDEGKGSSLTERVQYFVTSADLLWRSLDENDPAAIIRIDQMAQEKEDEIKGLPFVNVEIDGVTLPAYRSDLGFAAAYWRDVPAAVMLGVYAGEPYFAVGSDESRGAPTIAELGIEVDKAISQHFGIIEDPERVAAVVAQIEANTGSL